MEDRSVSIKIIIDKLMRHPMLKNIQLEAVVDYAIDFMRIVGCPATFQEKTEVIPIKEYRGILPCDFYEMTQVRSDKAVLRYSTDSFHMSPYKNCTTKTNTYKIQGDIIFTSIPEGFIEVAYRAIAVDKDGLPLVPDNSKFFRALENYVKLKVFEMQFDEGKLHNAVLQNAQQQYAWAVGAYESDTHKLTLDKAEAFYNSWRTMLIRPYEHTKTFLKDGDRSHLKVD